MVGFLATRRSASQLANLLKLCAWKSVFFFCTLQCQQSQHHMMQDAFFVLFLSLSLFGCVIAHLSVIL